MMFGRAWLSTALSKGQREVLVSENIAVMLTLAAQALHASEHHPLLQMGGPRRCNELHMLRLQPGRLLSVGSELLFPSLPHKIKLSLLREPPRLLSQPSNPQFIQCS